MVLLGGVSLGLAGCGEAPDQVFEQPMYVFGTIVKLTIWGESQLRAQQTAAAIETDLQAMHRDWHAWHPSPLTDLNGSIARGETITVSSDIAEMIRLSQDAERRSDGMFNPAAGRLFGLWGFHQDERPTGPPPTQEEVAALVAHHPSTLDLTLDGNRVNSTNPAVQLDLGGIAKGYAGDLAIAHLRQMGVHNAIFNAGGGLQVIGRHGDRPWRIGIRHPQGQGVLAAVQLGPESEGMHTSGNYERFREYQGRRYQHIIDTRTGMPVDGIVSATVVHPIGAWADAAATAMVIAGRCWPRIAGQMGLDKVLLVDEQGTVYMTPEMERRVTFEKPPSQVIVKTPWVPLSPTGDRPYDNPPGGGCLTKLGE